MTVGERIKFRREQLNLSQDELAKRCGYKSRSSIQKLETLRAVPTSKISVIASALEISESYLMGWYETDNFVNDGIEDATLLLKIRMLNKSNRDVILATIDAMLDAQG